MATDVQVIQKLAACGAKKEVLETSQSDGKQWRPQLLFDGCWLCFGLSGKTTYFDSSCRSKELAIN